MVTMTMGMEMILSPAMVMEVVVAAEVVVVAEMVAAVAMEVETRTMMTENGVVEEEVEDTEEAEGGMAEVEAMEAVVAEEDEVPAGGMPEPSSQKTTTEKIPCMARRSVHRTLPMPSNPLSRPGSAPSSVLLLQHTQGHGRKVGHCKCGIHQSDVARCSRSQEERSAGKAEKIQVRHYGSP